jgi:hypothetical protein
MKSIATSRIAVGLAACVMTAVLVGGANYALAAGTAAPVTFRACHRYTYIAGNTIRANATPTCPSGWRVVSWNQAGAPGPAGATGESGSQGPAGETGSQGPTGATGPAGVGANEFGTRTGNAYAGYGTECTLGEMMLNPGYVGRGMPARGQLLQISQWVALFNLIGTRYGGDGQNTFALPDLRSITPNEMTYSICAEGVYPSIQD